MHVLSFIFSIFVVAGCASTKNAYPSSKDENLEQVFPKDNPAGEAAGGADSTIVLQPSKTEKAEKTAPSAGGSLSGVVQQSARIRKSPAADGEVVGTLNKGEKVACLKSGPKGWCQLAGGRGFVGQRLVKIEQ